MGSSLSTMLMSSVSFCSFCSLCLIARWDLYLYDGEMSLFRVAIGILKMHGTMLMRLDMGGILHFLHNIPEDMNEQLLFDTYVAKIDITSRHFKQLNKKVRLRKKKKNGKH